MVSYQKLKTNDDVYFDTVAITYPPTHTQLINSDNHGSWQTFIHQPCTTHVHYCTINRVKRRSPQAEHRKGRNNETRETHSGQLSAVNLAAMPRDASSFCQLRVRVIVIPSLPSLTQGSTDTIINVFGMIRLRLKPG